MKKFERVLSWVSSAQAWLFRVAVFIVVDLMIALWIKNALGATLAAAIFLLYEAGYKIRDNYKMKQSIEQIEDRIGELSNKIYGEHIVVPIDVVLNQTGLSFVPRKLLDPIQIFVDDTIGRALDQMFQGIRPRDKIKGKLISPDDVTSGLVWVITKATINEYAAIAEYFDKRIKQEMEKEKSGYIWSVNIIDPQKFDAQTGEGNSVLKHIKAANEIHDKKYIDMPALLRLQLVRTQKPSEPESTLSIPCYGDFLRKLKKSNNARKYYFGVDEGLLNTNVFITNVSPVENEIGAAFEYSGFFTGDYILYSDMLVLKWIESENTLYLIFGKEIIDLYKEIFLKFWKEWREDNAKDVTNRVIRVLTK